MRQGVKFQTNSFRALKAHLVAEGNMRVATARKDDIEAAKRIKRAANLPKPAVGPRVAR